MKINIKNSVALLTGSVLAVSAIAMPAAHAADSKKEKQLKTGAAILGALGAYFVVKGKTVPAVVAGAGAYYAYKKSKDERNDYSYNDNDDRYAQRTSQTDNDDLGYESVENEEIRETANRDYDYNEENFDNDDLGYDALSKSTTEKIVVID